MRVFDALSMGNKLSGEAQRKTELAEKSTEDIGLVKQLAKNTRDTANFASVVSVDLVTANKFSEMDNEINIIKATVNASLSNNRLLIIYTSSSSVYNLINKGFAANEPMPIAGASSYPITKL